MHTKPVHQVQVDIWGSEFNFARYSNGYTDDVQDSYLFLTEYRPITFPRKVIFKSVFKGLRKAVITLNNESGNNIDPHFL